MSCETAVEEDARRPQPRRSVESQAGLLLPWLLPAADCWLLAARDRWLLRCRPSDLGLEVVVHVLVIELHEAEAVRHPLLLRLLMLMTPPPPRAGGCRGEPGSSRDVGLVSRAVAHATGSGRSGARGRGASTRRNAEAESGPPSDRHARLSGPSGPSPEQTTGRAAGGDGADCCGWPAADMLKICHSSRDPAAAPAASFKAATAAATLPLQLDAAAVAGAAAGWCCCSARPPRGGDADAAASPILPACVLGLLGACLPLFLRRGELPSLSSPALPPGR